MERRLLKKSEYADYFSVSEGTVDTWVRAGKVTPLRTPGGYPRFIHPEDDSATAAGPMPSGS